MAFNITDRRASLRLNHILVGQVVDLFDFKSKRAIATAQFLGWKDGAGNAVDAPKVIKSMDQNWTMQFGVIDEDQDDIQPMTLVKDPAGFGAMFLATKKEHGDEITTTLRRVTAYAAPETIEASRAVRHAKPEVVAPVEGEEDGIPGAETTEEVVAEAAPAKQKRGRKAKAEAAAPVEG